jgi:hypothetical protein
MDSEIKYCFTDNVDYCKQTPAWNYYYDNIFETFDEMNDVLYKNVKKNLKFVTLIKENEYQKDKVYIEREGDVICDMAFKIMTELSIEQLEKVIVSFDLCLYNHEDAPGKTNTLICKDIIIKKVENSSCGYYWVSSKESSFPIPNISLQYRNDNSYFGFGIDCILKDITIIGFKKTQVFLCQEDRWSLIGWPGRFGPNNIWNYKRGLITLLPGIKYLNSNTALKVFNTTCMDLESRDRFDEDTLLTNLDKHVSDSIILDEKYRAILKEDKEFKKELLDVKARIRWLQKNKEEPSVQKDCCNIN